MTAVTTAMTDGTVPTVTAIPTIATVTASIAFYGAFVQGTDQVEALAIDPVLSEMAEVLGEQAGDSIDQIVRDVLVAGATVRYSGGATSRGGVGSGTGFNMTATVFRQAVRTLKRNNARPVRGNKYAVIIHPKQMVLGRMVVRLCGKLREFGETLLQQTIPSQALVMGKV